MPLTSTWRTPVGASAVRRSASAGKSRTRRTGPGATVAGSNTTTSAQSPARRYAAVGEAEQVGLHAGELAHRRLERHERRGRAPSCRAGRWPAARRTAGRRGRRRRTGRACSARSVEQHRRRRRCRRWRGRTCTRSVEVGLVERRGRAARRTASMPALGGDVDEPAADELGVRRGLHRSRRCPSGAPKPRVLRPNASRAPRPPRRVGVGGAALVERTGHELGEHRVGVERERLGQRHRERQRAAA